VAPLESLERQAQMVSQAQLALKELQERLGYLEWQDRQAREAMQARAVLRDETARRVQLARRDLAVLQGELESRAS
jgi:hypothetical protein